MFPASPPDTAVVSLIKSPPRRRGQWLCGKSPRCKLQSHLTECRESWRDVPGHLFQTCPWAPSCDPGRCHSAIPAVLPLGALTLITLIFRVSGFWSLMVLVLICLAGLGCGVVC